MAVVIDASVAAAWCLRDEAGSAGADEAISRLSGETGIVPGIFWHELRNVLIVAERKRRIEKEAAERHMRRLRDLPLVTDSDQDDTETMALARLHGLSAYDAAYLETARRRGAELVTFDRKLAAAISDRGATGASG